MQYPRPALAGMVERLHARSPLDEADRAALLALPHNSRTCPPATQLVRDGERADHVTLLVSGFACRYKLTGDGDRQIIGFPMASEFLDLPGLLLARAHESVQTLSEAEVATIPGHALRAVALARPAVAQALWVDTLVDACAAREWVVTMGRRDSRARVAHMLCEISLRLEAAGLARNHHYELPMTQEQLADALGLTPVHVNRVLKQLADEGLISRDKRSIRIADWARIRAAGDFNPAYLNAGQK